MSNCGEDVDLEEIDSTPKVEEEEKEEEVEEIVENEEESCENNEDTPEPEPEQVQPRRSARQPKKRKRTSSDSGGDEGEDSAPSHSTVPLSNTDRLINVGADYQAFIESADEEVGDKESVLSVDKDRDEIIWSTPSTIDDSKLKEYLIETTSRFRIPIDRALYILKKSNYDFNVGLDEVSKRREIRDIWTEEESNLFQNAFLVYGKNFPRIRTAISHRSIASIIQHYYDTKKTASYKATIDARLAEMEGDDRSDSDENSDTDEFLSGTCENCGEKVNRLKFNPTMNRKECNPCLIYLKLMRVPRPANLRSSTSELKRTNVSCPEKMKKYIQRYEELTSRGDGKPAERLKIGKNKEEEDDDCVVVDDCNLRQPAPPYIVETTEFDDPFDSDTCRMTRNFDDKRSIEVLKKLKDNQSMAVPMVWRSKQTKCMEDIEVLNIESRAKMYEAAITYSRSSKNDVTVWKQEMTMLRNRMDKKGYDSDLAPSQTNRSGRSRYVFSWSEEEKRDAVRCFHWYGDDFDAVSETMGTKTVDQIKSFYGELGQTLVDSIDEHHKQMRDKLANTNIQKLLGVKNII